METTVAVETIIGYSSHNQTGLFLPLRVPTQTNREYAKARQMVHTYIASVIALSILTGRIC